MPDISTQFVAKAGQTLDLSFIFANFQGGPIFLQTDPALVETDCVVVQTEEDTHSLGGTKRMQLFPSPKQTFVYLCAPLTSAGRPYAPYESTIAVRHTVALPTEPDCKTVTISLGFNITYYAVGDPRCVSTRLRRDLKVQIVD